MKHGLPFVGVAAALSLIACGSDKVELEVPSTTGAGASSGSGQGGGSGGAGGEGQGGSGGVGQGGSGGAGQGGAGGGSGGAGGTGGAGGATGCVKCSAILTGADPGTVCPGKSEMLFSKLNECYCGGSCTLECPLDCLPGAGSPSMGCMTCIGKNCKMELTSCTNDK